MVRSHPGSEAVVHAPARSVRSSSGPRGRAAQPETALAAAVREAVTAVLLGDFPPDLVVPDASISSGVRRERAAVRAGRANGRERRLEERGGWDEV